MYLKDSCSTHFTLEITPKEMATLCMCLTAAKHKSLQDVCSNIYEVRMPDPDAYTEMEDVVNEIYRQAGVTKDVCNMEAELQDILRNDYS